MNLDYIQLFQDLEDYFNTLEDAERGRLLSLMMAYAFHGEEPSGFEGNERILWPVMKNHIDRCAKSLEVKKANGSKGGRPKKNKTEEKAKETENNLNKTEEKAKEKLKNHNQDQDQDQDQDHNQDQYQYHHQEQEEECDDDDSVILPFDGGSINPVKLSQNLDALESEWRRMGNTCSETNRDKMTELLNTYNLQDILDAFKTADERGNGKKWPYITAILENWKKNGRQDVHKWQQNKPQTYDPYEGWNVY